MNSDQERGKFASEILLVRDLRKRLFPSEIFDEHAWTMLLILFVGFAKDEMINETDLIRQSGVNESAGRRWISHLIEEDQIKPRVPNETVALTATAITQIRIFLDQAREVHNTGN
jgi:hypothetical protein